MTIAYLLTGLEGRLNRQPFWIALLPLIVLDIGAYLLLDERWSSVVSLLLTYPQFALFAKRGHDRNVSAWLAGWFFAGTVSFDLMTILDLMQPLDQQNPMVLIVAIPLLFLGFVMIVDFGFRRGTHGPNRYGPDPLERHA